MKISQRHLIWVNLVLLALVAYFGAATVTGAIAARLTPPLQVHLNPPPAPLVKEGNQPISYYASLQSRDIFNAVKPVEEVKVVEPPKPTELRLKLWGIVVHNDIADSSYAVIEDLTTRRQELYKVNDSVAGAATIKRVEWDRVVLDRSGAEEILTLEKPGMLAGVAPGASPIQVASAGGTGLGGGRPGTGRPGAPNSAPGAKATPGAGESSTVQQIGDGQYVIDQSEVNSSLDNMNQLFTQIRAVPHFQGGQSTGFRLFAIRQGSVFDRIGLRNGDIIHSINGNDISDPSKALAMLQQLRGQNQYSVQITRNKEDKTLSYQIR